MNRLQENDARYVINEVVKGLGYLSKKLIMHRDIKLENILVHKKPRKSFQHDSNLKISDFEFKLGDMGLAKSLNSKNDLNRTFAGTPLQMAPELLNQESYDQKADVWSLGIMVFHLLTGNRPFFGKNVQELQQNLEKGIFKIPSNLGFSLECINFFSSCLKSDSKKRLDWDQLLEHPFLSSKETVGLDCRQSLELNITCSVNLREFF
jgi:serine/threonine-protein kinase ULK/ATG1